MDILSLTLEMCLYRHILINRASRPMHARTVSTYVYVYMTMQSTPATKNQLGEGKKGKKAVQKFFPPRPNFWFQKYHLQNQSIMSTAIQTRFFKKL